MLTPLILMAQAGFLLEKSGHASRPYVHARASHCSVSHAIYNLQVVVFALGPGTCSSDLKTLVAGLEAICCHQDDMIARGTSPDQPIEVREMCHPQEAGMSPREAFFADMEMCVLS